MIGIQLAVALAFLGYLLWNEGVRPPLIDQGFTVKVEFADAAGLSADSHAQATVAGVPEGQVTDVQYENGLAVATLRLDGGAEGRLHQGATAQIVSRSALQDLFVDVQPGPAAAPALHDGDVIPPSRTSSTVGPDRLVGVLDADTRAQVQVLVGQLAAGLKGRSPALQADLSDLATLVDSTSRVTGALAARRQLLARLTRDLDSIFSTLGDRNHALAGAVDAGQRTVSVTASRDRELAAAMRELPTTLSQAGAALNSVDALSKPLAPALTELRPFARRMPDALRRLRRFLPSGSRLIDDFETLTTQGSAPLKDLAGSLRELGPAATGLRSPTLKALPSLQAIDRNKNGIGEVGDRFSGVFSTNDSNGPILRGLGFFEPFNPSDLGFPAGDRQTAKTAAVKALTQVCLGSNPLACLVRYLVPGLPGTVVPKGKGALP
ncbi:MAG: phospholipid/cholesterol/gamma-HCH transport system substrate-binding protein [Solirubrobacterales bacterium]|nr:phospholipid/cholesterol/gamma-HCH transport system substrate-binding protein [Solirubrobacterales bacterium]